MKPSATDFGFTLALLCFTAFLLTEAFEVGPIARMVPVVVLMSVVILLSAGLISQAVRMAANREPHITNGISKEKKPPGPPSKTLKGHGEIWALIWVMVFPASLFLIGTLPAGILFTPCYLRFKGGESWCFSVCLTAVLWGFIYLVFVQLLGISLYSGIIWRLIQG